MGFIYEINGQDVEFEKEPTEVDIDEAANQLSQTTSQSVQPEPNILEKVRNNTPLSTTPQMGLIPTNKEEVGDLLKLGYNYSNPFPRSLINETKDVLGINRLPSDVEKQRLEVTSDYGKRLETGLGVSALATLVYGGYKGIQSLLKSKISNPIKNTASLVDNLTDEIESSKNILSSEQVRVDRLEGTAKTILNSELKNIGLETVQKQTDISRNLARSTENLRRTASDTVLENRPKLIKLFKEWTSDYGKRIDPILDNQTVPFDVAHDKMIEIVEQSGINEKLRLGFKLSDPEEKAYNYLQKLKTELPERSYDVIPVRDILNTVRTVQQGKIGKVFTPADRIITNMRRGFSEVLQETNPEAYSKVKVLNSEFSPKFKFKDRSYSLIDPFQEYKSGKYKVSNTAIKSLEDYAVGNPKINPTTKDWVTSLESYVPGATSKVMQGGSEVNALRNSSITIDELSRQSKLNAQKSVDSFIAREKSDFEQLQLQTSSVLENKTANLEKNQSILDSLLGKQKRMSNLKDLAIKTAIVSGVGSGVAGLAYPVHRGIKALME